MSKSDVMKMIEDKIAKKNKAAKNSASDSVKHYVLDFLNWADQLSRDVKNKDAFKQSIAGRLHLLEARLRGVDPYIRYEIEFNEENNSLDAIQIRYSHKARTADPFLPELQTFRMEDFLLEGIL